MPSSRSVMTALAMLIAVGGSLAAQSTSPGDQQVAGAAPAVQQTPAAAPVSEQPVSLAPFENSLSVGVHAAPASEPAPLAPPRRDHFSNNGILMIVGGAAVITGFIVAGADESSAGKNIGWGIVISGAVVGCIGLVRFLKQ